MTAKDINEIKDRRGWTAAELADACFVSYRTVERWLRDGCERPGIQRRLRELLQNARQRDRCASTGGQK